MKIISQLSRTAPLTELIEPGVLPEAIDAAPMPSSGGHPVDSTGFVVASGRIEDFSVDSCLFESFDSFGSEGSALFLCFFGLPSADFSCFFSVFSGTSSAGTVALDGVSSTACFSSPVFGSDLLFVDFLLLSFFSFFGFFSEISRKIFCTVNFLQARWSIFVPVGKISLFSYTNLEYAKNRRTNKSDSTKLNISFQLLMHLQCFHFT